MAFKYYITDTFDGCVYGTDDDEEAMNFSQSEDFFVVNAETGCWVQFGEEEPVKPVPE